jgi:hypothetical protein
VSAIFRNKGTSTPAFAATDHFVFEFIAGFFGNLSKKDLVTHQAFFPVGSLEDDVFSIIAPVSFGIVTSEGELLNVFEMCFIREEQGVCS